ncbi:thiol-disulfide oxidoreductase DCC family protein [soil metagenome]
MNHTPVILFDGVCNLCNAMVKFVIKRDKKGNIKFAPLQSEVAGELTDPNFIKEMDSFVFIEHGLPYTKSAGALRVCKYLRAPWPILYFFIIIPAFIRDGVYNFVAARRYNWFGRKNECMIPTAELQAKFLN